MLTRPLALCAILVAAGCGGVPTIDDPVRIPWSEENEIRYQASVETNDPIVEMFAARIAGETSILVDEARGVTQTWTELRYLDEGEYGAQGEVHYRSVTERVERDGRLVVFHTVEATKDDYKDYRGRWHPDALRVFDAAGERVATIPWSEGCRLNGPTEADLRGLKVGDELTYDCYRPLTDPTRLIPIRFVVAGMAEDLAGWPGPDALLVREQRLDGGEGARIEDFVVDPDGRVLKVRAFASTDALPGGLWLILDRVSG